MSKPPKSKKQPKPYDTLFRRSLQYIVGIMGNHIRQGHEKLPIVLYHGKSSPYPYSTEIWDCFELPDLAKQWALKAFQLIDLTVMSDEEIQKHGLSSAMEFIFKHYQGPR